MSEPSLWPHPCNEACCTIIYNDMMQVAHYLCRCACIYDSTNSLKHVSPAGKPRRNPTFQYQSVQVGESRNACEQQSATKEPACVPEVQHHNSSKVPVHTSVELQLPPASLHIISSDDTDSEDDGERDIVYTYDKHTHHSDVDGEEDSWHVL